jgi:tetratricopeptide (TPR) repeat protein
MGEPLERFPHTKDLIDLIKQTLAIFLPKSSRLPPEQEFNKLLSKRRLIPNRLVELALTLIDNGKPQLASCAVERLRSEFPPLAYAYFSAPILMCLGKSEQIDALFEEAAKSKGGRENIDPQIRACWAMYISSTDPEKAICLSKEVLDASPSNSTAVVTHLGLLSLLDPTASLGFFKEHRSMIKNPGALCFAGLASLRLGLLPEAEEYLRVSALFGHDPQPKAYFAEALYRLNRPAEALLVCREATVWVEQYSESMLIDFGIRRQNPMHYGYIDKKYFREPLNNSEL